MKIQFQNGTSKPRLSRLKQECGNCRTEKMGCGCGLRGQASESAAQWHSTTGRRATVVQVGGTAATGRAGKGEEISKPLALERFSMRMNITKEENIVERIELNVFEHRLGKRFAEENHRRATA
ncbi:Hypothetical predicted protein [Olea europaea subsp. europaea]|uniref:Uncharacterized protein n=1 Tax=Olea europaea subsp. europaea TaxID=158383 RepID=A0A8S0R8R8_OLEEU|nr:Hypothetical predicted protein [Olea europaea subsp. europaea]